MDRFILFIIQIDAPNAQIHELLEHIYHHRFEYTTLTMESIHWKHQCPHTTYPPPNNKQILQNPLVQWKSHSPQSNLNMYLPTINIITYTKTSRCIITNTFNTTPAPITHPCSLVPPIYTHFSHPTLKTPFSDPSKLHYHTNGHVHYMPTHLITNWQSRTFSGLWCHHKTILTTLTIIIHHETMGGTRQPAHYVPRHEYCSITSPTNNWI